MDLKAVMLTRRNSKMTQVTRDRERLSEATPIQVGDAIVRSHGNQNHERLAETTSPLCNYCRGVTNKCGSIRGNKIRFRGSKGSELRSTYRAYPTVMWGVESSLIDLNPETGTRAKATSRAERLNEKTSFGDDAIVRSHANSKYERLAEMTSPLQQQCNKKAFPCLHGAIEFDHELSSYIPRVSV